MVLGVSNSSAKICPKTCKTARKALPRTTASAADPPWNSPEICLGPQVPRTFFIFSFFFTPKNSLKNHVPQNDPKNLKRRIPDRPNVDFCITFNVHLGIDFHPPHLAWGARRVEPRKKSPWNLNIEFNRPPGPSIWGPILNVFWEWFLGLFWNFF